MLTNEERRAVMAADFVSDLHPRTRDLLEMVDRAFQGDAELSLLYALLHESGGIRLFTVTPERRERWMAGAPAGTRYAAVIGDESGPFVYAATLRGALEEARRQWLDVHTVGQGPAAPAPLADEQLPPVHLEPKAPGLPAGLFHHRHDGDAPCAACEIIRLRAVLGLEEVRATIDRMSLRPDPAPGLSEIP